MTNIRLTNPTALTSAHWQRWSNIQRQNPSLASPYYCPEFTQAVAAVRSDVEVAILEEQGEVIGFFPFQRGSLGIGKPVAGKLSDYHGPIIDAGHDLEPLALVRECQLAGWDFDHLPGIYPTFDPFVTLREESPYLDLSQGFDAYCKLRRASGTDIVAKTNQKARKCERDVGALRFEYDCRDDSLMDVLQRWKSAQYQRTGLPDVFSFEWTSQLLKRLREYSGEEFSAPLSVLWAGSRPAAIGLSLRSRGVLHCWFIAYEAEFASYSPGVIFFLRMAEAAGSLGIHMIDLGKGDERYKCSLASAAVPMWEGTVGSRSLSLWLRSGWRQTRDWVHNSSWRNTAEMPGRLIRPLREWMAYH